MVLMAQSTEEELIEKLAKLEHEQWVQWSKNLVQTEALSKQRVRRWNRLWVHWSALSEKQKETDREWARKVIEVLKSEGIL